MKPQKSTGIYLQWMVAQLEDGHGVASCQDTTPFYKPQFTVDEIEGHIVVTTGFYTDLQVGDIIKTIGGRPAGEELQRWIKLTPGSPHLHKFRALNMVAAGENGTLVNLEFEKASGESETISVDRFAHANLYRSAAEFDYPAIDEIEQGIYLINLSKINERIFHEYLDNLSTASRATLMGIIDNYNIATTVSGYKR